MRIPLQERRCTELAIHIRVINMNERIKELSDQAHEFALKTINFGENFGDIWIEKLGKLIIQDCIKELEISKRGDPYTGNLYDCEYNTCIKEQIEVLKARFGVN